MEINQAFNNRLGNEYNNHPIFEDLKEFSDFYDALSDTTIGFVSQGTRAIVNLDTHVFMSISGTLNSISILLKKGAINDSYALLRKYYDSTIINIYTNLYLEDHFSFESFVVEHIDKWRSGKKKIPEYGKMMEYIKASIKLKSITELVLKDSRYKEIRQRCNDHMHYNYYHYQIYNDDRMYLPDRLEVLNGFQSDLVSVFIQHFAYLFYLKDEYMMSTDYIDCLDIGITPEEDSQYWVTPFVQDAFDKYIKSKRADIANIIKSQTCMHLK